MRVSGLEPLERRRLLAITASFSAGAGILSVTGDSLANTIEVSRNAAGALLVNGGAVAVSGGTPTVANTAKILIFGLAGADILSLNESNGALPMAEIQGGSENDTITGGSGADLLLGLSGDDFISGKGGADQLFGGDNNDVLIGGDANDAIFGEANDDRSIWNPGDDSDTEDGGDGIDTVEVNGGNGTETFSITPNGARVRLDRITPAPFTLDIGTTENLVLNANNGDDNVSAADGLGALVAFTIDGGGGNDTITVGDGAKTLLGGSGNDAIIVLDSSAPVAVHTGSESASAIVPFGDSIQVNTDAGAAGDTPAIVLIAQDDTVLGLTVSQSGTLQIGGAVLEQGNGSGSVFSVNGSIDIAGGALLSRAGGSAPDFRALLARGYNSGGWNGTSNNGAIRSSLASSSAVSDGVGYGAGSEIAPTTIGSFVINPADTVIQYTLQPDANLDATVDTLDFNALAANFGRTAGSFARADFNYDSVVDTLDFNLLAASFSKSLGLASPARAAGVFGRAAVSSENQDDLSAAVCV